MTISSKMRAVLPLCGGFRAWMTTDNANAWHEFINQQPIWKQFREQHARVDALELALHGGVGAVTVDSVVTATMRQHELEEQLYQIAKIWYTEHVAPSLAIEMVAGSVTDFISNLLSERFPSPGNETATDENPTSTDEEEEEDEDDSEAEDDEAENQGTGGPEAEVPADEKAKAATVEA